MSDNGDEEINPMTIDEINYYWSLWNNCHRHGLPSGKPWNHQPEWLIEVVNDLDDIYELSKAWITTNKEKKSWM